MFVNIWLAMACFGVKLPNVHSSPIATELIKLFISLNHFTGKDLYATDISNLCVSIAALEVKKKNYVE